MDSIIYKLTYYYLYTSFNFNKLFSNVLCAFVIIIIIIIKYYYLVLVQF